jgi:oligopeptidase A
VNSFDHPLGEARYDAYVPEDVGPAMDAAEAATLALLNQVASSPDPYVVFGDATAAYDFVVTVADDLASVLDGAWNDASRTAGERAARFRTRIYQRRDLYDAIRAIEVGSPVEERLRADLLRRFERAGAHLGPDERDRLTAINARLAELGTDFIVNLQTANAASGVITDDVAGLPEDLMESARLAAVERGPDGFFVPYSDANATVVLRDARDHSLRAAMYRLTISRAAESNMPVVAEILALRQEFATLLGYANFVELSSAGRMVADPRSFLDQLARAYRPQADREHAELLAFARAYTGDPTLELTAADVDVSGDGFYASRLRESRSLASGAELRVSVEIARSVMLDALSELYEVTFTAVEGARWHPDVEVFDLRDAAGRSLARIWCDWYVRDGKRSGAGWMTGPLLATNGGPHLLTVVTNIPRAGADLGHLRVMWHEFGHAMHFAFTRTRYRLRSPDDGPHDFIEGPSRIMENWALEPEILRRMHVDEAVAVAVREENRFRIASRKMVQIARPTIDLALHCGEDPVPVKQRHLSVAVDPADATPAQFHHIFAGTYGAGHYAYQWAGVMDANLFARFAAEGPLNPATGRDYADKVLAAGAERDPADLIRDFLGHDIDLRIALVRDGVT